MNISYNWLKEYVDFDLTPEEVSAALTSIGLDSDGVDEVQSIKGGLEGLVVGKIVLVTSQKVVEGAKKRANGGLFVLTRKRNPSLLHHIFCNMNHCTTISILLDFILITL